MLDAVTGEIIWSASVGPGGVIGGIEWGTSTDGRRIFFEEHNSEGLEYQLPNGETIDNSSWGALDAVTGEILWQIQVPNDANAAGAPTYANGVVYAGALDGVMYALDAERGEILWQFEGEGASCAAPAVVDGTVYWGNGYQRLGARSRTFYAFALPEALR